MRSIIKSKRGSFLDLIIWLVIAFVSVVFIGLWFYMHSTLNNTMMSFNFDLGNNKTWQSDVVSPTIGVVQNQYVIYMDLIAFAIIFSMILSMLVMNYFVESYKVLFVLYFVITLVGVVIAVYFSNYYESIFLNSPDFGPYFETLTMTNMIIQYLPIWTFVIGLLSAIILFIGFTKEGGVSI